MAEGRRLKIFSFFAGCGILDLGFEMAGFDIEFVNEFFKPFLYAYIYSRKMMGIRPPEYGYANTDVNSYLSGNRHQLEQFMADARGDGSLLGFIGGPPCPDFSIAGKQRGRDGDNGKLSLSYTTLLTTMKPDFFLFENVKGLWKTARHRKFYEELKAVLREAGYCLTERLTNALEFGVPQDRDRILLFGVSEALLRPGYRGDGRTLLKFPWESRIRYSLGKIRAEHWPDMTPFSENSVTECPDGIEKELTVQYWFEKNGVESHPDAGRYFQPKAGLSKMLEIPEGDTNKKSYKRIHRWRYSPTVAYGNNEVHLHPYKARRLSVAEAMALQSLPREFSLPPDMTLTNCFKTIGNGVPFLMAEGVAATIRDYISQAVSAGGGWEMKFDFTPDPKVLIALTHTPMQPLDALCELIDNAIDSFYGARLQGLVCDNPMVIVTLPSRKQLSEDAGLIRIQDNGPGMSPDNAEKAIKAGFSGNNPYDTLGLFGMGFNISTGKLGNVTTFMTSREDMDSYVRTVINLERINTSKDYSLDAEEVAKADNDPYFWPGSHGTIIEITDWWPQGNANRGFVQKLVQYGMPKIREEIGRRYASILRKGEISIFINGEKCDAYEHCVWDDSRYVVRRNGNVPAVIRFDQAVGSTKRCGECTAVLGTDDTCCPCCGSTRIRTVEERVRGWIGIQRFDSETDFGIDLIRNGRAIRVGEKSAFFEYVDEFRHVTKDYPIDSQYGRIVGEISLDFVPVDFLKQDFQRSSAEWQRAMTFIRGNSSLQPSQPGASENNSPLYRLYQAYRRVRSFGRGDMYMGYWDADSRSAKRISRDTEKEYYKKFKQRLPGFYDDSEWWKLVESADQPPAEELPECPVCGAQNLRDAEVCAACGTVLKPKKCINSECGKEIPLSAATCPFCGASQTPTVLEPWTCRVCGTKNIASDDSCRKCGSPRGANHPLSKEELLAHSDKVDTLSCAGMRIRLADGTMSNSLQVDVYSVQKPMLPPGQKETVPLIISKEIGRITMFVDLSHPFFTKCTLSREQLVASEIAMYLYDEKRNLSSYPEHNLSNLTWSVLQANWRDTVEIGVDSVMKDAVDFLDDLRSHLREQLGRTVSMYFSELTDDEKSRLTASLIQHGVDLSSIGALKESGDFLLYAPYSFLLTVYHETPDSFFGGGIWNVSLASGGEELLGSVNVAHARAKIIRQYENSLQDVIAFAENQYSDVTTLQRVRLSIEFLRKEMSE